MSDSVFAAFILKAWIYLASFAGAVTGVFLKPGLNLAGKLASLFIGMAAAVFMGPLIVSHFAPHLVNDPKGQAFFYYLLASCANMALPELIKRVSIWAGDPLSLLKGRIQK